jgi:phospholipase C
VHGPNGFFRRFTGSAAGARAARLDIRTRYDERRTEIALDFANHGATRIEATVTDRYRSRTVRLTLKPGETRSHRWSLLRTKGWYDLAVTVQGDARFEYRYAGHLEDGKDSISDPGMGGLI